MFDIFPFVIGLLGGLHCLGMCGPLVLAYSIHQRYPSLSQAHFSWQEQLPHHIAFHSGRLIAYGLLGAAAAGLFKAADISRLAFGLRGSMNLVGGILLVFLGFLLLKVVPIPSFLSNALAMPSSFAVRWTNSFIRSKGVAPKMALGFMAGFLPCCLSWALIVTAATTQNPIAGFVTMTSFGLGTVPILFLTGLSSSFLSMKMRFFGERMAACSVIGLGVVLVLRGAGIIA